MDIRIYLHTHIVPSYTLTGDGYKYIHTYIVSYKLTGEGRKGHKTSAGPHTDLIRLPNVSCGEFVKTTGWVWRFQ